MNPAQFRLLLAGPKVCRLLPFFTHRGYVCDGAENGEDALDHMRRAPRHVLLVELDLGDMLLADLLEVTRRENLAGAVILLDDPAKSGLIVATLTRGVDGYVATPPDEQYLFRLVERQLLAQWALAQQSQPQVDAADKQRLEKSLELERSKVKELVKEIGGLRDELNRGKRPTTQPALIPGFGPSAAEIEDALDDGSDVDIRANAADDDDEEVAFDPEIDAGDDDADTGIATNIAPAAFKKGAQSPPSDDDDELAFDEETDVGALMTKPSTSASAADSIESARTAPAMRPAPAALVDDARTSPRGYRPPGKAALAKPAAGKGAPPPPVLKPGMKLGFDDVPKTRPANSSPRPKDPAPAPTVDEDSAGDLFVDVDEGVDEDTSEVPVRTQPRANRFLLTPDEE